MRCALCAASGCGVMPPRKQEVLDHRKSAQKVETAKANPKAAAAAISRVEKFLSLSVPESDFLQAPFHLGCVAASCNPVVLSVL